jgi:hypothetical protein
VPPLLQDLDDVVLVLWKDLGKPGGGLDRLSYPSRFVGGDGFHQTGIENVSLKAKLVGGFAGDRLLVTGQHFQVDPQLAHLLNHQLRVTAGRVK